MVWELATIEDLSAVKKKSGKRRAVAGSGIQTYQNQC
jgi:hypothetical protein